MYSVCGIFRAQTNFYENNFENGMQLMLTNPLATPVFDDPPPPATKTCRLVNISTEYSGKFTRANKPSFSLRGAITGIILSFQSKAKTILLFVAMLYLLLISLYN